MEITHSIDIAADLARVWELTEDVERWPSLTPTVTSVERVDAGPLRLGSQARIRQPGLGAKTWTVTELDRPTRFAWQTRLGTVRMTGRHQLTTTPTGCRNTLSITLEGFGSRLLAKLPGGKIRAAIQTENEGFKRHAEQAQASVTSTRRLEVQY